MSVRLNRLTASTVLMRLRTADNQAGGRLFVTANGTLFIRSDVSGVQTSPASASPRGAWTRLELCATAGAAGSLTLKVDGAQVGVLERRPQRRVRP